MMGNRQKGRRTEEWELDAIANIVAIPRTEINDIYKDFHRASKDYLLDKYEFRQIYRDWYRQSSLKFDRRARRRIDRLFVIFDRDRTGRLTFDEFISLYVMLQDSISPYVRLSFLLDRYSQSNGCITASMGRQLLRDLSDLYGINTDCQQVWRNIEKSNGSKQGFVPKEAFIECFMNHPAYSSALYARV